MPAAEISLVETWGGAAENRLGIVRHPSRAVAYLPGFELQPERWSLSAPLESWTIDGVLGYQFTPPAEVVFVLPDAAREVEVWLGYRAGAYTEGRNSDGVGIRWTQRGEDGESNGLLWSGHLNPRDRPEHREFWQIVFPLASGTGRRLHLEVDHGPADDGAWDWPVFANLRTR